MTHTIYLLSDVVLKVVVIDRKGKILNTVQLSWDAEHTSVKILGPEEGGASEAAQEV